MNKQPKKAPPKPQPPLYANSFTLLWFPNEIITQNSYCMYNEPLDFPPV